MRALLLISLFLISSIEIHASHAAGMDISYECISQGTNSDTYKITVKFYRDCTGISAPGSLLLNYSSSCGSSSLTLYQSDGPVNINAACLSYCNGGTSLGIEQYTYTGNITITHCSNWVLSVCENARNAAINTINNPGGQNLCVEATINNTVHCNNSPTFSQYPTPFICAGNYYCYNNGAIEIDGDSLVYSLITPLNTNNGGTVSYITPYSATNPVGGGSSFDPVTGNLCVTAPSVISGILAIKVSEYRNGVLIGSIIRDVQINVFSCANITPPSLSSVDTTIIVDINDPNSFTYELNCPDGNQTISFDINTINPPPPPPPQSAEITISINTSSWASEISWDITSSGTVVASGTGYSNYNTFVTIACVPIGPLVFNMYDSYGDGWNGGTYNIYGNGTLTGITSGGLTGWTSFGSNNFAISGGTPCVPTSANASDIYMTWNNGVPGANFTITNNNSTNPTGTFSWTPSVADTANSPYFFTVDVTNNACPAPGNFSFQYQVILNGSDISISPIVVSPSCYGLNNGSITTTITGSNSPFSYLWDNGITTQNLNNVTAGNYTLTVTDTNGCSTNETFSLTEPPPFTPTITALDISCNGLIDGSISVINQPNSTTYLWSNLATTSSITNLPAGNYSVTTTDINGCSLTDFFTISEPPILLINWNNSNVSCYGANDGSISMTINGGVPNYTISIPPYSQTLTNGLNNFTTPSVISAGTYNYILTDSSGCAINDSVSISEPTVLGINPNVTNVLCKDQNNGSIILNTNGGTSPYIEDFGTANPLVLSAGNYPFTITDGNGCIFTNSITITEPDSLLVLEDSTDATCGGYFDGTATLITNGGTFPYNTDWGLSNPNALNAGIHNYIVTDFNNCIAQGNVIINEPPSMQVIVDTFRVSCFGLSDGSATLTISGGAGAPYIENWGTLNSSALPAGVHIFIVTDINNCTSQDTALITQPSDIQTNPLSSDVSCFGDINGSAFLQISGGMPPYTQNWFGVDSSYLEPGVYPYQVTDNNNCIKDGNVTIGEPDTLRASASILDVDCFGENNGAINLNITGGIAPYTADFGVFNQYALVAGTYPFTITDINGCTFDSVASVNQANQIFLDFIATSPICRYDESVLSIHISNSSSDIYTMLLQDSILKSFVIDTNGLLISGGVPITLTPNFSGEVYIVSLTDDNGCEVFFNDNVHIEVKQLPDLFLNEVDICVGQPSYTLNQATPSGGTYFINDVITDYFDVENLEIGGYNIGYEYTDPITLCYNKIEEIITISESPEAGLFFSPQPTDMNNPDIFFRDNSNDILTSVWDLGDGTIIFDELSFWHTYNNTGTYIIKYYITNQYNCTDSVIENLVINPLYNTYIPTAFTPNDDNDNDYFYPSIIGGNHYNMKIYDRWGGIIFNEDNRKWDGTMNNNFIISGLYSYSITVFDFKDKPFIYTGLISLIK